jgi:CarD family transcriptional regulator
VLVPETDPQTTILAPVENVDKIGLRRIITEEKADQLISYLSNVEVDWVSDHSKRKQAYEETLREGDLAMIAKMIKELTVRGMEAGLNHCDKEMLPRAKKRLFSEIALAKGIDFEGALSLASTALS